MEDQLHEYKRAYELLKQIAEEGYLVKELVRKEIEELMTPDWMKTIEEDNALTEKQENAWKISQKYLEDM